MLGRPSILIKGLTSIIMGPLKVRGPIDLGNYFIRRGAKIEQKLEN